MNTDPSRAQPPSTWAFLKWSLVALCTVVALGLALARGLHALGIE